MDHAELLAKVLATENLNVRRSKVSTASFDIKNRTLTIPMWDNMSPEMETMLILHEVGHALFTPIEYIEEAKKSKSIAAAMNVFEDPRIERLMKERYPGSRKDFVSGYNEVRKLDILKISDKDVNDFNLLDRINIFFKAGPLSGVKFDKDEQVFVQRALSTVTIDDVVKLANDLVSFMSSKDKEAESEFEDTFDVGVDDEEDFDEGDEDENGQTEGSDGTDMTSDEEGEESEQESDEQSNSGHSDVDKEPEVRSLTMEALESTLQASANSSANPPVYTEMIDDFRGNVIVSYKAILENVKSQFGKETLEDSRVNSFKAKIKPQVSHLVSNFELRKAALVYALRTVSKTGSIDTGKIAQYKVKSDIFLRRTRFPEGKNHGMIMLLDWSASMYQGNTIHHSLNQVIQLVTFCRSVGIPHRVYAFSDKIKADYDDYQKSKNGEKYLSLLELFSSDMRVSEFNHMIGLLHLNKVQYSYPLGNTPLAPALAYMRKVLPEFKEANRLDKVNLITFTDGQNTYSVYNNFIPENGTDRLLTDQMTKKHYKIYDSSKGHRTMKVLEVNVLSQILRDRYGATVTSYFATNGHRLDTALYFSGAVDYDSSMLAKLKKSFSSEGFFKMKGYGRDATYIVRSSILELEDSSLNGIDKGMSAAKIASTLRKSSRASIKSKILIEKFVETIS